MGAFTCNSKADSAETHPQTDSYAGVVRMLGIDLMSTKQGADLHLGTFSLEVKSSGVSLIYGEIVELVRWEPSPSETELNRVIDQEISAGKGYADVSLGGRRLDTSTLALPPPARSVASLQARRQERRRGCFRRSTRCP